jgi:hypothetical protein
MGTFSISGAAVGFEVYLQCFGQSGRSGISRAAVKSLFPVLEEESEPDYWRVRYDNKNSCEIGVTAMTSDKEMLKSFYVDRPCGDLRLWEGLLSVLRMGSVVIFWPGGPPVVALEAVTADLPDDMIDSIGQPKLVSSAEELLGLLRES